MAFTSSILIISAEPAYQQELARELKSLGARAVLCESVGEAKGLLNRERFDLAFCTSPECDFCIGVGEPAARRRQIPVVMVSRMDDWTNYLSAMSAGAFDYIVTPLQPGEVRRVLQSALGVPAAESGVETGPLGLRVRRKETVAGGRKTSPEKEKKVGSARMGRKRVPGNVG